MCDEALQGLEIVQEKVIHTLAVAHQPQVRNCRLPHHPGFLAGAGSRGRVADDDKFTATDHSIGDM